MRGFTLIELLVVIAITAAVSALAVPFLQSLQVSADTITPTALTTTALRRAQQQALAGQQASPWGVFFDTANHTLVVFRGSDFSQRDPAFDTVTTYSKTVDITTDFGDTMWFTLYGGWPSASGTVGLQVTTAPSSNVTIDSYGIIKRNE